MKKTLLILSAGLVMFAPAAVADTIPSIEEHAGNKIVLTRTTPEVKKILKEGKSEAPHNIPAPRFVVKSENNGFILAIGGQINPILGYDIGNNLYKQPGAGISFVTNQIPVPAVKGHKADFYINPLNAAVDFQVVGLGGTENQITGYIKLNTNGNNTAINLTRAYITWRGFTAGQKLTLMQDDYACQPPTIDPEGPSGCVSNVSYEISYTSKSYNGFRFAAGLDIPSYYSSSGIYKGHDYPAFDNEQVESYADAEQLIPDIPAWVEYSFSQWNRIRLSGVLRNFAYRDLIADKTCHKTGWGAMLSGNLQPTEKMILYFQAVYGRGIGNYIQDLAGLPLSWTPRDSKPGKVSASPMAGFNFGLTYNFSNKLQWNAMCSEARIWDVEDYTTKANPAQDYKYGLYVATNLFYNITPFMQWGIEYLWGQRKTWHSGRAHDNRIQTQIMFTL